MCYNWLFVTRGVLHFQVPCKRYDSESINKNVLSCGRTVMSSVLCTIIHGAMFQQQSPPPNYASTSHDQPCAVETRGKVAALCRLETGGNWQHTNTYTPTDNTMPLLQVKNLQPVALERTALTFNRLVSLKADATPFSTDSVYHPSHFQSQRCTWKFCPQAHLLHDTGASTVVLTWHLNAAHTYWTYTPNKCGLHGWYVSHQRGLS